VVISRAAARACWPVAAAILLLLTVGASSARAVTSVGRIAFASNRAGFDWDVWVMNADGTGAKDLTQRTGFDSEPAWSPDGTKIAFVRDSGIAVMNADGSNVHQVVSYGFFPAWSPDGTKIAFSDNSGVVVMNADGSGPVHLTDQSLDYRPSWSPNGTQIAFDRWVSFANQTRALFIMRSDGSDLHEFTPDTVDSTSARFSPDGQKIAFRRAAECCGYPGLFSPTGSSGGIAVINIDGSGFSQLTPFGSFDDAPTWSPDGSTIAFSRGSQLGGAKLYAMNADGGSVTQLTDSPYSDGLPAWQPSSDTTPPVLSLPLGLTAEATSPAGTVVSFTATAVDAVDGPVAVVCSPASDSTFALGTTTVTCTSQDKSGNVATGSFAVVVRDSTAPTAYAALVFENQGVAGGGARYRVQGGCWDAVGVVSQTTALNGIVVTDGQTVALQQTGGAQKTKVLADGTLRISAPSFELDVACRDAAGNVGKAAASPGPRGKLVFISNRSGSRELYTINRDGTDVKRLTFNDLFERTPKWSPDGTQIAFSALAPDGNWDIYIINADGTGLRRLTTDPGRDDYPTWTPDGANIVYDHGLLACPCALHMINLDGSNDHVIDVGPGNSFGAEVSPNGTSLAFANDRGGSLAIYVAPVGGGAAGQVTAGSVGGDFQPRWSPDGRRILFLRDIGANDNDLYVVNTDGTGLRQLTDTPTRVESGATWSPSGSEIVFSAGTSLYSTAADGSGESQLSTGPAAPFTETFDRDGVVDPSLFHTISDSGGSILAANGRLEAMISHNADPSIHNFDQVDEHIGSQCRLNGDFDFQVDYSLVTWPAHNGFFAMLNAIFADGAVARSSSAQSPPYDEQYNAWTSGPPYTSDQLNTTDRGGQLRLVRHGGLLYEYERATASALWALVHVGPAGGSTVAAIGLWAPGNSFAHLDGEVDYDNFRFSSGPFTCPTWWSDSWPDWERTAE
jgi:Tol biopolymer transport system component